MSRSSAVFVDNTTLLSLGAKQNCGFYFWKECCTRPCCALGTIFLEVFAVLLALPLIKLQRHLSDRHNKHAIIGCGWLDWLNWSEKYIYWKDNQPNCRQRNWFSLAPSLWCLVSGKFGPVILLRREHEWTRSHWVIEDKWVNMSLTNNPNLNTHHYNCFLITSVWFIPGTKSGSIRWRHILQFLPIYFWQMLNWCSLKRTYWPCELCSGRGNLSCLSWKQAGGQTAAAADLSRSPSHVGVFFFNKYISILLSPEHLLVMHGERWPNETVSSRCCKLRCVSTVRSSHILPPPPPFIMLVAIFPSNNPEYQATT